MSIQEYPSEQRFGYPVVDPADVGGIPLDIEKQHIEEFTSILPFVKVTPLEVHIDHASPDPKQDLIRTFDQTQTDSPTAHLVPELSDLYDGPLSFRPLKSRGGKASRHGVFFGSLVLDEAVDLQVAVKPFEIVDGRREARKECLDDYFVNSIAREFGFGALQPAGIMTDAGNNYYSLTLLEKSLDTFESLDWKNFYSNLPNNPGMQELWLKAARQLAIVHDTGDSFQGDLYPRNIATTPDGSVFFIDWEYGHVSLHSRDLDERFGRTWKDLNKLINGMSRPTPLKSNPGIGMFSNVEGSWWEAFREVFFDEYVEYRVQLASQGKHHMKKLTETQEELKQLAADLKVTLDALKETYLGV